MAVIFGMRKASINPAASVDLYREAGEPCVQCRLCQLWACNLCSHMKKTAKTWVWQKGDMELSK